MTQNKYLFVVYLSFCIFTIGLVVGHPEASGADNKNSIYKNIDPCTFLDQAAVEALVGTTLQPGAVDHTSPNPNVVGCVWRKPVGSPAVMLQYWPKSKAALSDWALPDSDVQSLSGYSGEAIAVINRANPGIGLERGLTSVVIRSKDGVIALYAPYLKAPEGSVSFNDAVKLADTAAIKASH